MKTMMILALAMSMGIPGNITGERMEVISNSKRNGCVLLSEDGNLWATETKVRGTKKGKTVTVYMSDNNTPGYRLDDIIVYVERR